MSLTGILWSSQSGLSPLPRTQLTPSHLLLDHRLPPSPRPSSSTRPGNAFRHSQLSRLAPAGSILQHGTGEHPISRPHHHHFLGEVSFCVFCTGSCAREMLSSRLRAWDGTGDAPTLTRWFSLSDVTVAPSLLRGFPLLYMGQTKDNLGLYFPSNRHLLSTRSYG